MQAPQTATIRFAARPPSANWEPLTLPELPGSLVWAWFKPPHAPDDVVLRVSDETTRDFGHWLTMRRLFAAAGLDPAEAQCWLVYGQPFDPQQGHNPLLDQTLPPLAGAGDPSITVRMRPDGAAAAHPGGGGPAGNPEQLLHALHTDWHSILLLETNLSTMRKQLNAVQGRLQSLNRDLSPDERLAADSLDVKDWQDARRWLRDAMSHVSRCSRDYDIGVTSAAGQRNRFEQIYNEIVVPRRPVPELAALQREFETYRKLVQNLVAKIQTTLASAGRDGEQRAQQILNRINAKRRRKS